MKVFKLHILPILLSIAIIVVGGGTIFFAMRFGFSFQNRIITHDIADAGALYSPERQKKLTETTMWSQFESYYPKNFINGKPGDDVTDESYRILANIDEEASLLARFFLGHLTTEPYDVTVDLSNARYAVADQDTSYADSDKEEGADNGTPAVFVDNCIVSFDTEGEKYSLRLIYMDYSNISFIEFENLGEYEYTVSDVNASYRIVSGETEDLFRGAKDSFTTESLLYDPNIIVEIMNQTFGYYIFDETESLMRFESYRFHKPISYFLAMYGMLGNLRTDPPEYVKSNLSLYINTYTPQITYTDGYIYISYQNIDGKGGMILKYSVADKCITGMAVN